MRSNPGFGVPQHPISVNNGSHHITPQSLFCFALDTEDMRATARREQKTASGFEFSQFGDSTKRFSTNQNLSDKNGNLGVTTPTGRRCVNFFGNVGSTAKKVKDDSQARTTTKRVKLEELAKKKTWRDEIE